MNILFLTLILTAVAMADDLSQRPPAFSYQNGLAVFADFTNAQYDITYDITQKKAYAEATIKLQTAEEGYPIFDSQVDPATVLIDGVQTSAPLVKTPLRETSVRIISTKVLAGEHVLKISLPITQLVEFSSTGVRSAYWMSDLNDRGYLERYLPTNFLFDRIPVTFNIQFKGAGQQRIYANGVVSDLGQNGYKIVFPPSLNPSCLYFHTVPMNTFSEVSYTYRSIDGREIPVVIYMAKPFLNRDSVLKKHQSNVNQVMEELEGDYGPFLHASLTVYIAGDGGMEYSGATMTSEMALGHELFHSYFARGVMPSDGNAGWIDEALASWRDKGYSTLSSLRGTSQMANHGTYNRATDREAYAFGERFISLLDGTFKSSGGLKPFLRKTVEQNAFAPLNVPTFITLLNSFYGTDIGPVFRKYVYGGAPLRPQGTIDHPIHKQMTLEELKEHL